MTLILPDSFHLNCILWLHSTEIVYVFTSLLILINKYSLIVVIYMVNLLEMTNVLPGLRPAKTGGRQGCFLT